MGLEYLLCAWVPTMCIGLCYCFVYDFSFSSKASSMKWLQIILFLGERKWYSRTLNVFFSLRTPVMTDVEIQTQICRTVMSLLPTSNAHEKSEDRRFYCWFLYSAAFNCVPTTVAVTLIVLGNSMLFEVEIILFRNFAFKVRVREDRFRVDAK